VLPRGRHAAPRRVVREVQRARMLEAMVEGVAEKGYVRVSVADVIERARVSRKTFYEQFGNKEDCFLAAYDAGVDQLLEAIDATVAPPAPDWLTAARRAVEVYVATVAASPAFARAFLIEVLGAGPRALARRDVVQERFAAQLAAIHRRARADIPEIPAVPSHTFRAAVGAVNELVTAHVLERGADTLPELTDAILDVHLALLVGRELAARIATQRG
jgi:AcrR family transcriptional regulator